MLMLLRIALRTLQRHRRRTFFSAITIAFGIMFFIVMDSMLAGMDRGAIDNMIALTTGAIRLQTPEYAAHQDALPLRYGHVNYARLRETVRSIPHVKGVTARTRFVGQLSIYTETKPVIGTVIDPATDSTVYALGEYIEGTGFSNDTEREILLGKKLAGELGLDTGSFVTLYAQTKYDAYNADDFRIVGLLNTTNPTLNASGVFISYAGAESFLDLEGHIADVMVGVNHRVNFNDFIDDTRAVQSAIKQKAPGSIAETFLEQEAGFFEISKSKRSFGFVFLIIILLIAAVGIFNTVLMSVYERIRETGVLRAFGLKSRECAMLFLLEGFLTGIIGAVLGLLLGSLVNCYLVFYGFPLDAFTGDAMGDFPIWGTVYGQWNIGIWIVISLFTIITATIAGLIPARKAGSMEIIATLRFV